MSVEFLDSNIFIYLFDNVHPHKQAIARDIVRAALEAESGAISYQVVQETLKVITTKLAPALPQHEVHRFLYLTLVPLWHVMPSADLFDRTLVIQARYRFGFYDSLIVAAALDAGCTRLYTEDMQHGQQIESLTITNPFKH